MPPSFRNTMRPLIVLFGDSITQQGFGMDGNVGWASLLASDYARRADFLERGFFGYNTNHAVEHLLPCIFGDSTTTSPLLEKRDILFCTVYFGANDATLSGQRQHVPLEEYAKNLEKIITTIRQRTGQPQHEGGTSTSAFPIILLTPPPLDAEAWRQFKQLETGNRSNEMHRIYGQKLKAVAEQHTNCICLDVFDLLGGDSDGGSSVYGRYLTDGLHLNEEGNRKVYQGLMELIKQEFPHLAPMEPGGNIGIPLEGKPWDELC